MKVDFDEATLGANRTGQLSPGQLQHLDAEYARLKRWSATGEKVGVGSVVVVSVGGFVAAALAGERNQGTVGAVMAIVLAVTAAVTFRARRERRALPDFSVEMVLPVQMVEGVVRCLEDSDSARLVIGDVTFWTFPDVLRAFVDGARYRVHYVSADFKDAPGLRPISAQRL